MCKVTRVYFFWGMNDPTSEPFCPPCRWRVVKSVAAVIVNLVALAALAYRIAGHAPPEPPADPERIKFAAHAKP